MPRFFLILGIIIVALGMISMAYPAGASAVLVVVSLSIIGLVIFRHYAEAEDKDFIARVYVIALLVRLFVGMIIEIADLREYLGPDALTYDFRASTLLDYWTGVTPTLDSWTDRAIQPGASGWGMYYLVAGLYMILGRTIFAVQAFCAVFGAATAPMIYFCSMQIFQNKKVARTAAWTAAVFPALVIWSSQMLKDGLIVFLLVLAMTMVLQLQKRFTYGALLALLTSLGAIITLRFYIFYMVAIAVVGSFLIGATSRSGSIVRRAGVLVILGLSLTYFGVIRNASRDFERYGNLERVQLSRLDLRQSADSGFGEDVDVSTTEGAISALPIGFLYLMLAPFPWQMTNLRQAITLPEILVWWAMMPLLVMGIWYALKNKLRVAFPILLFSVMLTLAYSIFLGNVGTAYRQRTQIQVFLFIFIAVGWQLWKEKREDKRLERLVKQRRLDERLQAGAQG